MIKKNRQATGVKSIITQEIADSSREEYATGTITQVRIASNRGLSIKQVELVIQNRTWVK